MWNRFGPVPRRRRLAAALLLACAACAEPAEQWKPLDVVFRAEASGNPFDVQIEGEFSGPKGAFLRVPGFYDGDGVWKIRFSPTAPGRWQLRTVSSLAALHAHERTFEAAGNTNPAVRGRLRIHPEYRGHFAMEDGGAFFLMGYEADWLWAAGLEDPQRTLMHRLIGQIDSRGFNYVFVNLYAHDTRWCPGRVNQWDVAPSAIFPWEGSNEAPDHSRLNPKFFAAWDRMMDALRAKGIVAHVMLKVYNKAVNWPPPGSAADIRFFRYVLARYQAYPNIVWDFSKEAFKEPDDEYQRQTVQLIRRSDAYDHLVTVHDDDEYTWNPEFAAETDFRVDQEHFIDWADLVRFERNLRRWPVVNAEFGYELGVEPLPTHSNVNQVNWQELLRRAYTIYFAGGYGAYYYNNTAWDIVKPDPEPPGLAGWQLLKRTMTALPWWRMKPDPAIAAGAMCLTDRRSLACYQQSPQSALNLTGFHEPLRAEWVNTWTGDRERAELQPNRPQKITKPKGFGGAPAVLIVETRAQDRPAAAAEVNGTIVIEAEKARARHRFRDLPMTEASGGRAVQVEPDTASDEGWIEYAICVATPGSWRLWMRTFAQHHLQNGLYADVDGRPLAAPPGHPFEGVRDIYLIKNEVTPGWHWSPLWQPPPSMQASGHRQMGPILIPLAAGDHTLRIRKRKIENPIIDKIVLTLADRKPEGMGPAETPLVRTETKWQ